MKPNSSRVDKWHRWLDLTVKEVLILRSNIEMRSQLDLVIKQSPVKEIQDSFWRYLHFALLNDLVFKAVKICERQNTNKKRRIQSLRALMEECAEYSDYFTRRRFVGRIHPPKHDPGAGSGGDTQAFRSYHDYYNLNNIFDELVGAGQDRLPRPEIENDIALLDSSISSLKLARDKILAHNDPQKHLYTSLTYEGIPNSVRVITHLTSKYYTLITRGHASMTLEYQSDLIRLFGVAWIENEDAKNKLRTRFDQMDVV